MKLKYLKKKKYWDGGKILDTMGSVSPEVYSAGATTAAGLIGSLDKSRNEYGYADTQPLTKGLSMAGQGAALGTTIAPGIGTAIGAGAGLVVGGIQGIRENKLAQEREAADMLNRKQDRQTILKNVTDSFYAADMNYGKGNQEARMAAYGGPIKLSLGGDTIFKGPSHEKGGINIGNNTEVEGGETMTKDGYVFSDRLTPNGVTNKGQGKTFAKLHKKMIKLKDYVKPESKEASGLNTLEELLKTAQEKERASMGLGNEPQTEMRYGGNPPTDPPFVKWHNENKKPFFSPGYDPYNPMDTGTPLPELDINYIADPKFNTNNLLTKQLQNSIGGTPDKPLTPPNIPNVTGISSMQNQKDQLGQIKKDAAGDEYKDPLLVAPPNSKLTNLMLGLKDGANKGIDKIKGLFKDEDGKTINDTSNTIKEKEPLNSVDQKYGSKLNKVLNQAAPFIDNLGNYVLNQERKKEDIPNQRLTTPVRERLINLDAQRAEAERQRRGFNLGVDRGTSNSAIGRANKLAALSKGIQAEGQITAQEQQANQQIKSRVDSQNKQIEAQNNQIKLNNEMRQLTARDEIRANASENIANLDRDIQTNQRIANQEREFLRQEGLAQEQADLLVKATKDKNAFDLMIQDPMTIKALTNNPKLRQYLVENTSMSEKELVALLKSTGGKLSKSNFKIRSNKDIMNQLPF